MKTSMPLRTHLKGILLSTYDFLMFARSRAIARSAAKQSSGI